MNVHDTFQYDCWLLAFSGFSTFYKMFKQMFALAFLLSDMMSRLRSFVIIQIEPTAYIIIVSEWSRRIELNINNNIEKKIHTIFQPQKCRDRYNSQCLLWFFIWNLHLLPFTFSPLNLGFQFELSTFATDLNALLLSQFTLEFSRIITKY